MTKAFANHSGDLQSEALTSSSKTQKIIARTRSTSYTKNVKGGCIPKRLVFSIIGFLASTLAITLNTNLSLAIVSMVDRSNETIIQVKSSNECISNQIISSNLSSFIKIQRAQEEFHWSPEMEGWLLGTLYIGQLVGFLPGGRMAELYGGKLTLIGFMLLASLCTLIAPIAAHVSVHLFAASRFLVGVGTAPVVPVFFYLISRWIPDSERSLSASFILAGYGVGGFVSFLTAGILCDSEYFGGWPSVFYFGGIFGLLWCLLCFVFISERPIDHPSISEKELKYITENLGPTEVKQITKIPWKSILKSSPFWSLAFGYFGQFWILGFFCSSQPFYMGTILNIDSKLTGELSCLPHLARGLFACLCGYPADWALKRGYVGKEFIRKGATAINSVFACLGFVAIILAGCDPILNTVIFTVGGLLGDFITFGVCMAGVDIAPNLSGTLSGILSFLGVVPFFVIPALVGYFTKYERSRAQWRYVYYIIIGVVALTTFVYVFFGTSEPQPWGTFDVKEKKSSKKEDEEDLQIELKPEDC